MKRLLLSLILLSATGLSVYAQSLELSNTQGVIPPNSIIVQEGTPDSVELITYMHVKNIGSKTIDVLCKKSELSMLDSTEITMCWAGGCYPPFVNISPNAQTITAGQTITDFVGHYTQSAFQHFKPGESVVRWVFYDKSNVNDSMSVTIKYTSYPLGVDEAKASQGALSNAYPNPASAHASFSYSIPAGAIGSIIIRNLVGSTVYTEQLRSANGKVSISTENLSDGIYFYSLLIDGRVSQTKKLIVKR
jgi:hypothetical protein